MGIEPISSAWKAGIIAIIRHARRGQPIDIKNLALRVKFC